jgi:AraC-like DNA-binding protein
MGEAARDARVSVEQVWGSDGAYLAETLDEHADPVVALRAARYPHGRAERVDPLVAAAVTRLACPRVAVAQLADYFGVSERQLRRRVSAPVGYGLKRLARVLRLGRALEAARAGGDLARVAVEVGYADQAHFANDCRALAGVAPSVMLA